MISPHCSFYERNSNVFTLHLLILALVIVIVIVLVLVLHHFLFHFRLQFLLLSLFFTALFMRSLRRRQGKGTQILLFFHGNNYKIIFEMLHCQACFTNPQTELLTKCCKLFICKQCRDKYQKIGTCLCGKPVIKKLCVLNPQLFEIIKNYYENKPEECDRCNLPAQVQCKDCSMLFCSECNSVVHNGKGFAKHLREPYKNNSPKKNMEKARRKQDQCQEHKQPYEFICQCSLQLCSSCSKNHKQSCSKTAKTRSLKQYKEEYFSQILFKIKQITQYKQKLLSEKAIYEEHFSKQKSVFESYGKLMEEQMEGLKKILEIKSQEIKNRLSEYWRECVNGYNRNLYVIDYYLRKFDDYGRLSEKFVEKTTGLDFLEKRVKRIYINHDFFNFKIIGIEETQASIVNLSSICRDWEANQQQNILINYDGQEEKNNKEKKVDFLSNFCTNSDILLECSQNPLNHRPLTVVASHNEIQYQFLHLPYQDDSYEIEYGVGLKMKGQEVFKRIKNKNGLGLISNLNPSTKYRVRMRVSGGQWGPINEIKTQQIPKLSNENCLSKNISDPSIVMIKTGIVFGSNEIYFGVHNWEIKIFPMKNNDEDTACISIGVCNKQQKKPIFVGTTLNYGYQKSVITVKINLNCDQNRLTISSSTGSQDEVFQNLPNFPIFPAIQNKGNNLVQIQCTFL